MQLALKVIQGPLKDQVIPIFAGMTLGRQGCSVLLNDSKVSGLHAKIEKNEGGTWQLIDNGSKNGTWQGSDRIESIELKPGTQFQIGESSFELMEAEASPKPQSAKYWYDVLAEFLESHSDGFKDSSTPLVPLQPALVLEFVRGVQMSSKWIVGYGPRDVGAGTPDLPIWEPDAPRICFSLHPTSEGILFKTSHPNKVLLNEESVGSQVLKLGDRIRIDETLIEVDFVE